MIENIQPYGSGLNLDDDIRIAKSGDGRERKNIEYDTSASGGVVLRAEGNAQVPPPYMNLWEESRVVGKVEDKETNSILYLVASASNLLEAIFRKNADESMDAILIEEVSNGIIGITDSTKKWFDCAVADGKFFWVDKNGIPKKINITRCDNYNYWNRTSGVTVLTYVGEDIGVLGAGTYVHVSGIGIMQVTVGNTWDTSSYNAGVLALIQANTYWDIENDITQVMEIRQPPVTTVIVEAVTDSSLTENKLSETSLQFAYRYIYKDYEQSVWSKPSAVITNPYPPEDRSTDGYNAIDIILAKGNNDVLKVEIAVCNAVTQLWFKAGEVKPEIFLGQPYTTFRYTGITMYGGVSLEEMDKPYDAVPIEVGTVAIQENRIIHGDITEGYSVTNPITLTITPEYEGVNSVTLVYETPQSGWGWEQSLLAIKTFNTKIYSLGNQATDVVDLGYLVEVNYTWNGIVYPIGQVLGDGVKTWYAFGQELADVLNTIYTQPFVSEDPTMTATDVWARVETELSGNVIVWAILGIRKEVALAGINMSTLGAFNGIVEENEYEELGRDLWDYLTVLSNFYFYDIVAHFDIDVSYSSKLSTYKGNSMYEGGLTFYDTYLRKAPMISKKAFTIPIRSGVNKDAKVNLDIKITGTAPSWAEYYSFTQSDSSVLDSAEIVLEPSGVASTTSIEDIDAGDELIQFRLTGVTSDDITSGYMYYAITNTSTGEYLIIYKDSAGASVRAVLKKTNQDVYIDGVPYSKWETIGKTTNITGYAIAKKLTPAVVGAAKKIQITFNETIETGVGTERYFRFDIAPYVNALKEGKSENIFMPRKGDFIRIKQSKGGGVTYWHDILLSVTDIDEGKVGGTNEEAYFSTYVVETSKFPDALGFTQGGIIEIYRLKEGGNSLFYEEPMLRAVPTDKQFSSTNIKVYNGDTYLRPRRFTDPNGGEITTVNVEDFRVSDNITSKVWNKGRVNIEDSTAIQERLKSAIRHGGRLLEETKINDLCRFDSDWIMLLNDDNGVITRVLPRSNSIRVLQERRATTVDIGRSLITRPDGSEDMVAIDRVFGSKRESQNYWGCVNPESILDAGDTLYYYDKINGQYLSDGANGQFPISGKSYSPEGGIDFKMHTFFNDLASVSGLHIVSGWNEQKQMLYVTDYTNSKTVGFHTGTRRWLCNYDFVPEMYAHSGVKCYSFKAGELYRHNEDTNTFYGVAYDTVFDFIANQASAQNKIFDALNIRGEFTSWASMPNVFIEMYILPNDSYPRGMYSKLTKGMFVKEEGEYKSSIFKNMLTSTMTADITELYNGEDMRGNAIRFVMNTGTYPFKLFVVSVVETPSM